MCRAIILRETGVEAAKLCLGEVKLTMSVMTAAARIGGFFVAAGNALRA